MANITMNISKSTVTASAYLVGNAYKSAVALAITYEGKIGRTDDNRFTVTFDKVKIAKKFKSEWESDYAKAHAAYTPKPTEPKAPKTPKTPKVTVGKGNAKMMSELNKLAGAGKSANKQAAAIIRKYGLEPNGEVWEAWQNIR